MLVREFAERVLFGTTLEDKLTCPDVLSDDEPGGGLSVPVPEQPGRPAELRFRESPGKFEFPGTAALEDEERRGRLLHFFANHELLATELMALVLLKFPDAPRAFRSGVLQTLKEEQTHTRMYLRRLEQLGVGFGDHAVNGFFWRLISPVSTPLDYVSRLSLTFEQANLDYTRFFAGEFEKIGDEPTRALLDRIYRDEIGHVGYGLKWFRKWKHPEQSDWDAFRTQLTHPLSPSRAKAEPFNCEGRLEAGLDREFIDELFVYSRSKGRTPGVYHFNAFAEAAMGRPDFEPNRQQAALVADLENLPQFLCRRDDVVLVRRRPASAFLAGLKNAGFELPEFVELADGRIAADDDLRERKLAALEPWAWSREAITLLQPLAGMGDAKAGVNSLPTAEEWERDIRPLFSKARGPELLAALLKEVADDDLLRERLCPPAQCGRVSRSVAEAVAHVEQVRAGGHQRLVAKTLFGVAGGNQLRLWEPELTAAQRKWLERMIANEGEVLIEPWQERVMDFSFQFERRRGEVRRVGMVTMINDRRGQYLASACAPRFGQGVEPEVAALFRERARELPAELHERLAAILSRRLDGTGFNGPLGIDAFVYREPGGGLRIHPVVELNPRFTMGRLMWELMRQVAPGRTGRLELLGPAALKRAGHADFAAHAAALTKANPVRLEGEPRPRIAAGAVCLNDPAVARGCLAVLRVD